MKEYRCIYDGGSFIDGIEFETFKEAKESAEQILTEWASALMSKDEHNMMVCNCMTWVEWFDDSEHEWVDIWYPTNEFCESIGFIEI